MIDVQKTYQVASELLAKFHIHSYPFEEEEEESDDETESKADTWWEELGYEKSPCDIRATDHVFGLDKQIKELRHYISGGNISCLHGRTGTGKSSTIKSLSREMKDKGFNCAKVDSKKYSGLKNIDIKEKIIKSKVGIFSKIFGRNRKSVLFIDEFQAMPKYMTEQIEAAFNEEEVSSVVCVQLDNNLRNVSSSFQSRLGNRFIETSKLDAENCFKLLNERFDERLFSDNAYSIIMKEAEYIPRVILETCDKILQNLHEAKDIHSYLENHISPAEVNKLIGKQAIQIVSIDEQEEDVTNDEIQIPSRYKLPDLPKEIIFALFRSNKNLDQLQDAVNKPKTSIRSALHRLQKKESIVSKLKKPGEKVIYSLTNEFRREVSKD